MTPRKQPSDETTSRTLFETLSLGVVFQSRDGEIIDANPAACEILGLERDEILGRTSLDARWRAIREDGSPLPGDSHPAMVALRTGRPVRDVVMGVHSQRAGETRWILVQATPEFRPGEPEPFQVHSTFEDITELRRSAEAMRESEEKFRSIVESSPMGTLLYRLEADDRLVFTGANPAADEILGVDSRQFVGKTIEEAFPPLGETEVPDRYREACRTGKPWSTERIDYQDEQIQGAYEVHAFRTGPDTMAVKFLDITERKRVEAALRDSEKNYRALFESAGEAIFLMRGARFIDCNPMALVMFGGTREQIVGSTPMDFSPPQQPDGVDSAEKALGLVERALSGEVLAFEWEHLRPDGTPFFAEVALNCLELGDEQLLVAHTRDITEHKRMEERLAQAHRMETVGQLAGGVAHDFNNLLVPILGYAELLLGKTDPDDPRRAELEAIRKAAERARALTRQLLAFGRKQVLDTRILNLNEVVADLEKILRRTIREDIELRLVPAPDLLNVRADIHQVEQVLMNLALNASDAMAGPGTLTIETANVELEEGLAPSPVGPAPGAHVMLAVRDTGAGMDEATRQRVFEPFFTTKEEGRGTGLGLSTVYGIVRQHRGTVTVQSRPGEGSRFNVYLPVAEGAVNRPEVRNHETESPTSSGRIVVVEDDRMVRDFTSMVLRSQGYQTLEAETAVECLRMLEDSEEPVDLLLTDVVMPGMNGRELFERLAIRRPALKVIYMSGYTNDVIASRGVLDEGVQLIQKPFTLRELTSRIREVLGGEVERDAVFRTAATRIDGSTLPSGPRPLRRTRDG